MNTTQSTLLSEVAACRDVVEDYTKRIDDACVEYYNTGKFLFPNLSRAENEDTDEHCNRVLARLVSIIPDAVIRWESIKYPNGYDQQIERMRDVWVRRRNLLRVFEKTLRTAMEVNKVSPLAKIIHSPWASGSFYLVAILTLILVIRIAFGQISPFWLPVSLVFGVLGASLVGAFQLAHDKALSETGFLQLMTIVLKNLPLIRLLVPKQKGEQGAAPEGRALPPDDDTQQ